MMALSAAFPAGVSARGRVYDTEVNVPDEDLEDYIVNWPLKLPKAEWAKRGYAHLFHETILQADEGCDFDFMRGEGK